MQAYAFTKYLGRVRLEINDETGRLEILLLHFYMIQQLAWGAFPSHYAFIFKWEYYLHELSIFQQVGLRAGQGHQFCLTPPLKKTQWWNKRFRWDIIFIPSKYLSMWHFDNYYNYHMYREACNFIILKLTCFQNYKNTIWNYIVIRKYTTLSNSQPQPISALASAALGVHGQGGWICVS